MPEQRPGKAAEATIPGPQNQNANILEPALSTHLQPQCRHHRGMGGGPPGHRMGMDMAHWGPAAGPHGQRAAEERTGQGAGGRQGPRAWDTERSLLSAKDKAPGEDPPMRKALHSHCEAASEEPWLCLSLLSPPIPEPRLSPPGRASPPSGPGPPRVSPRCSVPSSVKTPLGTAGFWTHLSAPCTPDPGLACKSSAPKWEPGALY